MHGRMIFCLSFVAFLGCTEPPAPIVPDPVETQIGQSFDASSTGTISGRVIWDRDIPTADEYLVRAIAFNPYLHKNPARYTTPHVPQVKASNRGVANAVVFLRG